jgi:hypothetical protein
MAQTSDTIQVPADALSNDVICISREEDSALTSVALAVFVVCLGHSIDVNDGTYNGKAIFWLTVGLVMCFIAVVAPRRTALEKLCRRWLPTILAAAVVIEAYFLMRRMREDPRIALAFGTIAVLGCVQFFRIGSLRWPLLIIMLCAFFVAGEQAFNFHSKFPGIDVFMFQSDAAWALSHGLNPYSFKYPSVYPPGTPFYGPGVVDAHGYLTVGFPYPPLSLLLTLPAYWIGHDIRYAHLLAMALSAGLIAATRPSRVAFLSATMLLLTPRVIYILDLSFTEPFLVLLLGLYLSSKQYSILAVPLLPLLLQGKNHWRMFASVMFKALLVAAVINLPFFVWNAPAFLRSIVVFQFLQGFRWDALSYLVLIRKNFHDLYIPLWISLVPLVVMIPVSVRRAASSPAGFAAAVALVHMLFFAFNKQAFGNYYYFVIATACWAIGVAKWADDRRGFEVILPAN